MIAGMKRNYGDVMAEEFQDFGLGIWELITDKFRQPLERFRVVLVIGFEGFLCLRERQAFCPGVEFLSGDPNHHIGGLDDVLVPVSPFTETRGYKVCIGIGIKAYYFQDSLA